MPGKLLAHKTQSLRLWENLDWRRSADEDEAPKTLPIDNILVQCLEVWVCFKDDQVVDPVPTNLVPVLSVVLDTCPQAVLILLIDGHCAAVSLASKVDMRRHEKMGDFAPKFCQNISFVNFHTNFTEVVATKIQFKIPRFSEPPGLPIQYLNVCLPHSNHPDLQDGRLVSHEMASLVVLRGYIYCDH